MRRWHCSIILVLLLAALPSAQVQAISGLELLDYCQSDVPAGRTHCKGYLGGVLEASVVFHLQYEPEAMPFCSPLEGIKPSQLVMVVVKYLENHPGKLHEESIFLVLEAFVDAFPCEIP